jgi:hypothetical protein
MSSVPSPTRVSEKEEQRVSSIGGIFKIYLTRKNKRLYSFSCINKSVLGFNLPYTI